MIAFGKQIQIHLTQQRAKAVGIFAGLHRIAPINLQQVRPRLCEMPDKQAGHVCIIKTAQHLTGIPGQYIDICRAGQISPDKLPAATIGMCPQHRKRIGVLGLGQCVDIRRGG